MRRGINQYNSITIVGNLISDAVARTVDGDTFVAATISNNYYRGIIFFDVDCWGEIDINGLRLLTKGTEVAISGHLTGQDKDHKHNYYKIVASSLIPLDDHITQSIKGKNYGTKNID